MISCSTHAAHFACSGLCGEQKQIFKAGQLDRAASIVRHHRCASDAKRGRNCEALSPCLCACLFVCARVHVCVQAHVFLCTCVLTCWEGEGGLPMLLFGAFSSMRAHMSAYFQHIFAH